MSNLRKFADTGIPEQLLLDGLEAAEKPFPAEIRDVRDDVKRALAADVKGCTWSREQIAHGLSIYMRRDITVAMIDAMLAPSKEHRFPAEWIPAWVRVTGSCRILTLLCAQSGMHLADGTQHDLAELARLQLQQKKAAQRAEALKRKLWEKV
jgi:hypothetical protein